MKTPDEIRRLFLFAAAAYLVLAVPHTLAAHPNAGHFARINLGDVIAGVEKGLEGLAEAQQATGAYFPGN